MTPSEKDMQVAREIVTQSEFTCGPCGAPLPNPDCGHRKNGLVGCCVPSSDPPLVDSIATALADARAESDARVRELEEELRIAEADAEHFNRLAFVDVGANPPVTWKERATAAESRIEKLVTEVGAYDDMLAEMRQKREAADAALERARAALTEISKMKDLCLLGPLHDQHGERLHALGANKAFNQCADIALAALAADRIGDGN